MLRWNLTWLAFLAVAPWASIAYAQNNATETDGNATGRRPIAASPSPPNASFHVQSNAPSLTSPTTVSGKRPRSVYAPGDMKSQSTSQLAANKTKWLPPRPSQAVPTPTINPSLPKYDTRVASNQLRKPVAEGDSSVVHSAFYEPQPPSMPSFPGGAPPIGSSNPSAAPSGTFPPGTFPQGNPPTFGGSGGSLSDAPPSTFGSGAPTSPQPLIPGGGSSPVGNTFGGSGSTLPAAPAAPPASGVRSATPPAASYPMPGIAGQGNPQGNIQGGVRGTTSGNTTMPQPLGSASGVPSSAVPGAFSGATPMTNMTNPNYAAPATRPGYATGEPFVTGPPRQVEMPYTHATVANNSCLPGWFQRSSTTVATTPTTAMNNTTSGVYPANTYPTNPSTTNPNGYPGVPGYIVPPTVTQNMAPQMFSPNNNGYTPLVNWGTESSNVTIGRGMFGGPTVYVNNEPVRNFFRYVFH